MNDLILLHLIHVWLCIVQLQRLYNSRKSIVYRRWWVKPDIQHHVRDAIGGYKLVFTYLKFHDEEEFEKSYGMNVEDYNHLFNLIKNKLHRRSRRKPLQADLKLAIVLSFLHNGGSPKFFAKFYRIGVSTMFKLLNEVCAAIVEILMPIYFLVLSKRTWLKIAQDYEEKWNMPHCLGAIDGRHFNIKKPPNSGSLFYNYKHFFSIVLLATCDAHRRFTWFNFGDVGSVNDASIFNNSDLYEKMQKRELNIPKPRQLPRSNVIMPYFFIGDDIFTLQNNVMKPYRRTEDLTYKQKIYNYRIKRARLTIECSFGILTSKWAILQKDHAFSLSTFENIVIATLCLHNMLITRKLQKNECEQCTFQEQEENEEEWEEINLDSKYQRDLLADYFVSEEGAISWQDQNI